MTESLTELALFELLSLECRVHPCGATTYRNRDGRLHRMHGPAIEYSDGGSEWFQNGLYHRIAGPAVECADGSEFWYQKGRLHRLDGPAIQCGGNVYRWYIDGTELTKAEWQQAVASMEAV